MDINNIITVHGRMFQVKRILPEKRIKMDTFENWAFLLKQYYHVDTILRANEQLWMCNEILIISFVDSENKSRRVFKGYK